MKMYRCSYGREIEELEVKKHTEKSVWYLFEWGGKESVRMERKNTEYCKWFTSKDEAISYIGAKLMSKKRRIEASLVRAEQEINAHKLKY